MIIDKVGSMVRVRVLLVFSYKVREISPSSTNKTSKYQDRELERCASQRTAEFRIDVVVTVRLFCGAQQYTSCVLKYRSSILDG